MEEKEDKNRGYWLAVGSFRFRNFKDLYDNIKGRTGSFNRPCSIVKDGKGLFQFPLKYEVKLGSPGKFVLEWEPQLMMAFQADKELAGDLAKHLPKFQRVGSTTKGAMGEARWYGKIDIRKLG
jgi:hypothetical protein